MARSKKTHGLEAIRAHASVMDENPKITELAFGLVGGDEIYIALRTASLRTLSDQLVAILNASSKAKAKKPRARVH